MNLYLIERTDDHELYDVYLEAVVAAENEEEARGFHPSGDVPYPTDYTRDSWVESFTDVKVSHLGVAKEGTKKGVICSSFNAG